MIILTMIVKDEAPVIRRCLESVLPSIDAYVIADTGSSDATMDVVREVMADTPGLLIESEWSDFATNRNEVLELARDYVSRAGGLGPHWSLTIDADEILEGQIVQPLRIKADAITLDVEYAGTNYRRTALTRLDRPWRWVGPVHEVLELDGGTVQHLASPTFRVYHEGARSRDPQTYAKDAQALLDALEVDPDNPRYQFYLAESLRFAGDLSASEVWYRVRAGNMSGFDQERFWSRYQVGHMGHPDQFLAAFDLDPTRVEPLVALAAHHRMREEYRVASLFADLACMRDQPSERLFHERAAYDWRRYDELAIASYYLGDYATALANAALAVVNGPIGDVRLAENLRLCQEAVK